ncbi:myosin-binding protein 7-like [Miscanthus floridulus]|uniref:myosin-binding protein 7-like n=1 Tax=Miscanthus floridulus TaxID=154761 RepID=UPI00345A03C6
MAGEDPVDACPLCGGAGPPSRVALAKRAPPADATAVAVSSASVTASGGDEASALREALARQWRGVADLQAELEAERGAAAGAASEAMSMILRLQRDKSEVMMEARQYRRYAEERFAHDAAEVGALHDALDRRDAAVRALAARLRACQARLLHLGFPASPSPTPASLPTSPTAADRPCSDNSDSDDGDGYRSVQCLDHPADVGTPRTHHLLNRIPSPDDSDKAVVMFGSPRRRCSSRHARTFSGGDGVPYDCRIALADEFPLFTDRDAPDQDDDEEADRVYTVDAVHGVPVMAPEDCCYFGTTTREGARAGAGGWAQEDEIQKLKARLQALEADRESMRHAILSMGDEKAQVVLLREIAQQLCRDAAPFPAVPLKVQPRPQPVVMAQRKVVKRQSSFAKVFIVTVIKWVVSIFCWRRKSSRIRYPIGMCGSNVGLMLVLDRFSQQRQKKIPKRKLSASTL